MKPINMGIDIQTFRRRIGAFLPLSHKKISDWTLKDRSPGCQKIIILWLLIILLLRAGIEPNPGPGNKSIDSSDKLNLDQKEEIDEIKERLDAIEENLEVNTKNLQINFKRLLARITSLEKEMKILKLQNLELLNAKEKEESQTVRQLKNEVETLSGEIQESLIHQEALENNARRDSLILRGLIPKTGPQINDEEQTVRNLMYEVGMAKAKSIPIKSIHSLAKQIQGRLRPPIIVNFSLRQHRDEFFSRIIKAKVKLKNHLQFSKVSVQSSLSKFTIEKRKFLLPHFYFLKSIGVQCFLRDASLKVNNATYEVDPRSKKVVPTPPWINEESFRSFTDHRNKLTDDAPPTVPNNKRNQQPASAPLAQNSKSLDTSPSPIRRRSGI